MMSGDSFLDYQTILSFSFLKNYLNENQIKKTAIQQSLLKGLLRMDIKKHLNFKTALLFLFN